MIKLIVTTAFILLLSACATKPEYVMPTLKYNKNIGVHVSKKAYVFWQHGQEQAGSIPSFNGGGIAGMIGSVIEAENRKNNPSQYYLTYGKAEQITFITNFRDALADQHVFSKVEIISNPNLAKAKGVLINIKFKSSRVADFGRNYKITLTVEMSIKSENHIFTRTYLTESDEGTLRKSKSYNEQVADVSQQMLDQLMKGIKQWSRAY